MFFRVEPCWGVLSARTFVLVDRTKPVLDVDCAKTVDLTPTGFEGVLKSFGVGFGAVCIDLVDCEGPPYTSTSEF